MPPKQSKAAPETTETTETTTEEKKVIPKFKFDGDVEDLKAQIQDMKTRITEAQNNFHHEFTVYRHFIDNLGRHTARLQAEHDKAAAKKAQHKNVVKNQPKYVVSDALADFMGLDKGSEIERSAAIGFVNKYCKTNGLGGVKVDGKVNGKMINMDTKLKKLFPNVVKSKEQFTYNSVMKHIGQHLTKVEAETAE
jgi:chromatin remodeling complex protein RSC6